MNDIPNKEKEYHNKTFRDGDTTRQPVAKFGSITKSGGLYFSNLIRANVTGEKVLDLGCGRGYNACKIAKNGGIVTGIDVSDVGINAAKQTAIKERVEDKTNFLVMNAEELKFDDNYFDIIVGGAILHHLDLDKVLPELRRVLKDNGKAIFNEPLGNNPFINLYRKLTPQYRTEDEHPLVDEDFKKIKKHFNKIELKYFHLTSLLSVPFRNFFFFDGLVKILEKFDELLFYIPFMRKQAWVIIMILSKKIWKFLS